jgi:hypothetical protein
VPCRIERPSRPPSTGTKPPNPTSPALSFDVLTTYADYIPEQETENPLPEPVAPASVDTGNAVNLHRSTAG